MQRHAFLLLGSVGKKLEDVLLPERRHEWNVMCSGDCTDTFTANATDNLFPRMCSNTHKEHDKREPGLFRVEIRYTKTLCLCSKPYCCSDRKNNKYKYSSIGLNKRTQDDCGDGQMSKYRKVLEESVKVLQLTEALEQFNMVW